MFQVVCNALKYGDMFTYCNVPNRVVSCCVLSCPCRVVSVSCHVRVSCRVVSCRVRVVLCCVVSCRVRVVSCCVLSCPCRVRVSCLVVLCLVVVVDLLKQYQYLKRLIKKRNVHCMVAFGDLYIYVNHEIVLFINVQVYWCYH